MIGWIIDGTQSFGSGDEFILNRIEQLKKPVILIVNKVDMVKKEKLLETLLGCRIVIISIKLFQLVL